MSASLADLRAAVVSTLKAAILRVDIDSHGGTFTEAELARFATKAPAIRIAIVGIGSAGRYNDGRVLLPVHFAAVAIGKDAMIDGRRIERDLAGLGLAHAIELAIAGNRFGLEGVLQPRDVSARNEYSGELDKTGVCLWQVTWTSGLLIGEAGVEGVDDAIAALSQLWLNGVEVGTDQDVLPEITIGAPQPEAILP